MCTYLLSEQCVAVVCRLLDRHDWRLLDQPEFSAQVRTRAQETGASDDEAVTTLAINLYCQVWHAACGDAGQRRERAYIELAHYLYDRACHKYGDAEMAREITQDAIVLVAEQLENCQNPGAFMAFALLKLWNAATTYFRRRDRQRAHTAPLPDEHAAARFRGRAVPSPQSPETTAVDRAMRQALLARLEEIVHQAPRARNQLRAVFFKFLHGYSDEEIAEALDTSVSNVYVLRSRGLKRLRQDAVLRRLARDSLGEVAQSARK